MAGTCASAQFTLSALPFISTSTNGFPERRDALEQALLRRGQIEAGAVAAGKARRLDRHLLALDLRGEAADEDDQIGLARRRDRLAPPWSPGRLQTRRWIAAIPRCTLRRGSDSVRPASSVIVPETIEGASPTPHVDDQPVVDPDAIAILASKRK